jgi:conjugative transposon TraK protein
MIMFTHFKNIDTAFKHIKVFAICFLAANVLLSGFFALLCYRSVNAAQGRVFILHNGKELSAFASDRKTNLPVVLRDHIKTFHEDFFNLSPDDKAIQANITKALYLADESAKKQYDNLRESGYYNNLIAANISQEIKVDSTILDTESQPYRFTCYATEKLIRSSSTTVRKLVTRGVVEDIRQQSDNNPHGFLIRRWEILENGDESVKTVQP